MKVLSIDWDFFFPDIVPFDWGHREDRALYLEYIWRHRVSSRNLISGEWALDVVLPNENLLRGFWRKVVQGRPRHLMIVDSHADLCNFLESASGEGEHPVEVHNFDQHHDICYSIELPQVHACDNWVGVSQREGWLEHYKLIYPEWRLNAGLHEQLYTVEKENVREYADWPEWMEVEYGMENIEPTDYTAVFICRSSAWTPAWCDNSWLQFIRWWKRSYPTLWANRIHRSWVEKARSPSLLEARRLKVELDAAMVELRKK